MKTPQQAAEEHTSNIVNLDGDRTLTGHQIKSFAIKDFLAGYSVAMEQQREFYALVREMLVHFNNSGLTSAMVHLTDMHVFRFCDKKHDVLKHLSSFTEREQPKD